MDWIYLNKKYVFKKGFMSAYEGIIAKDTGGAVGAGDCRAVDCSGISAHRVFA